MWANGDGQPEGRSAIERVETVRAGVNAALSPPVSRQPYRKVSSMKVIVKLRGSRVPRILRDHGWFSACTAEPYDCRRPRGYDRSGTCHMGTKACIIHVGTHKTGTTSFQSLLAQRRRDFERQGLHYPLAGRTHPTAGRMFSRWTSKGWVHYSYGHHKLAWELTGRRRDRFSRKPALAQLEDELKHGQPQRVLLSSEIFECLHRQPSQLCRIRTALQSLDYTIDVLVTLRDPGDYVQSLYVELAAWHGFEEGLEQFVEAVIADGSFAFRAWDFCLDYSDLMSSFGAIFGEDHIHALRYDPTDSVVPLLDVSSRLLGIALSSAQSGARLNARATEEGNQPTISTRACRLVGARQRGVPMTRTREVLTAAQREAIRARFQASLEEALNRYGVQPG